MPGPYDVAMTEPPRTAQATTQPAKTAPALTSPLEEATARVGDRWTLLLVQALLDGPRRFNELLEALPGIAPNVLSQRLKHLERERVLVSQPYSRRPPRFAYELTAAGRELAGALRLLAQWGADHPARPEPAGGPAMPLQHRSCGTPLEARWYCPTCTRPVDDNDAGDLRFA